MNKLVANRNVLADGTFIPSTYRPTQFAEQAAKTAAANISNNVLLSGYVTKVHAPTDSTNISKTQYEYDVVASYRAPGSSVASEMVIRNCKVMGQFGSQTDFSSYTLRGGSKGASGTSGANVLVLCENGATASAYIIGATPHMAGSPGVLDGHHFYWVFNGVQFIVNDDGELSVEVAGKTAQDGKVQVPINARVYVAKDGSVTVEGGNGEIVSMRNGSIAVETKGHVGVNAGKVYLGINRLAPVVRATDSFQEAFHNFTQQLKDVSSQLSSLVQKLQTNPYTSPAAMDCALLAQKLASFEQAVDTLDKTIDVEDAISNRTLSD